MAHRFCFSVFSVLGIYAAWRDDNTVDVNGGVSSFPGLWVSEGSGWVPDRSRSVGRVGVFGPPLIFPAIRLPAFALDLPCCGSILASAPNETADDLVLL